MKLALISSVFLLSALLTAALFILGAGGFNPNSAAAQTSRGSSLASPIELAEWQAQLVLSSYQLHQTDKNLSSVLTANEKLIALTCMPDLPKTLQWSGSPSDPTCLRYIEETLKFDAENPMALCARDGIDSRSCEEAYAAQQVFAYSERFPLWGSEDGGGTDLDLDIDSRSGEEGKISLLTSDLMRFEGLQSMGGENEKIYAPQVKKLRRELLHVTCRIAKLKIETPKTKFGEEGTPRSDAESSAAKFLGESTPQESPSAMDEIVQALKPSKVVGPSKVRVRQDGIKRTRYISGPCDKLTSQILTKEPANSAATCMRVGEYSPDCIKAMRRQLALSASAASKRHSPKSVVGTPAAGKPERPASFTTF
jgi:hypothetical protein